MCSPPLTSGSAVAFVRRPIGVANVSLALDMVNYDVTVAWTHDTSFVGQQYWITVGWDACLSCVVPSSTHTATEPDGTSAVFAMGWQTLSNARDTDARIVAVVSTVTEDGYTLVGVSRYVWIDTVPPVVTSLWLLSDVPSSSVLVTDATHVQLAWSARDAPAGQLAAVGVTVTITPPGSHDPVVVATADMDVTTESDSASAPSCAAAQFLVSGGSAGGSGTVASGSACTVAAPAPQSPGLSTHFVT